MAGDDRLSDLPRQDENHLTRRTSFILGCTLLLVHTVLLFINGICHSPVFNEAGHLAAGLYSLQTGRFELFRVNPPLVRTVAAVPAAFVLPKQKWRFEEIEKSARYEHETGTQFLKENEQSALVLIQMARCICIPFSLIGAIVCWRWSTELFGRTSGILALGLWCTSPMVLGHASLMTPDAHGAAMGVCASYCFWRWLYKPTWRYSGMAGISLGLAFLSKLTFIFWVPIYLGLYYLHCYRQFKNGVTWRWSREIQFWFAILGIALMCLNAGYLFRGIPTTLGRIRPTYLPTEQAHETGLLSRIRTCVGNLPIPVPEDYLRGISIQQNDFQNGRRCYLNGQWRENEGWWYFYLAAMGMKTPLGTLGIGLVALWMFIRHASHRKSMLDEFVLLVPVVVMLVTLSLQSKMTIHLRYFFPAIPFIFIWISRVGTLMNAPTNFLAWLVYGFAGFTLVSSLGAYPHSLSYFNELIGQKRGHLHLLDSNSGWDQDLLFLKRWIENNPHARPLRLATLGMAHPKICGLDFPIPPIGPSEPGYRLPTRLEDQMQLGPIPGWYAIDINRLHGTRYPIPSDNWTYEQVVPFGLDYSYFKYFQPVDIVGDTIHIFRLDFPEVNRVRTHLGLAELPQ